MQRESRVEQLDQSTYLPATLVLASGPDWGGMPFLGTFPSGAGRSALVIGLPSPLLLMVPTPLGSQPLRNRPRQSGATSLLRTRRRTALAWIIRKTLDGSDDDLDLKRAFAH
jgi:hypothetical protein